MKKNLVFENSLACLQHPLTLLSIAVLLLNDHVLKTVAPSWLTGKLSDFAGLFFFPFIVAAGLSLALAKFDLSRQRIGQIAFGIVAIWFVLLKTSPLVNSLTAQVASLFVGAPAKLIMDWTDLMALVSMWPAWMMWKQSQLVKPTRLAYVALSVGALATMATSGLEWVIHNVTNLEYSKEGIVYAADRVTFNPNSYPVAQSLDGGLTWEHSTLNNVVEKRLPILYCGAQESNYCVRITVSRELLESIDNGEHWRRVRLEYVIVPNDLILFELDDTEYVVVAIGEQGVLRRKLPDGDWEQVVVQNAGWDLLYASSIWPAFEIARTELIVWVFVAFLVLLITHVAIWNRLQGSTRNRELALWLKHISLVAATIVFAELTISFGVIIIFIADAYTIQIIPTSVSMAVYDALYNPINALIIIFLEITLLFSLLLFKTNNWIQKTAPEQKLRQKFIFYSTITIIGVCILGSLPWPLWAMGIIERYQWALLISISVSVLITMLGYRSIRNAK